MNLISIILGILSSIPQIISIIKDIIALIHNINPPSARAEAYHNLADAMKDARRSGDMSGLKALHDQLSAVAQMPMTKGE